MKPRTERAPRRASKAGVRPLWAVLGVGLATAGCGEASGSPAATTMTGGAETGGAETGGAETGGGAGGAAGLATGEDGGSATTDNSETCTLEPSVTPAPELTGRWGLRTIASRYAPATGLTPAFHTRTISVLLVDQLQTDTEIRLDARYCAQHAEDPAAPAHVVIPESYASSLAPFTRLGTYAADLTGTTMLRLPPFVEVVGAELDDPAATPLPTTAEDPSVIDQDGDDLPGVTIKLSGLVSGDLYVVQRQTSELVGIAVGPDRLEGRYDFTTEQNVLDANPSTLKLLAAQTAVADPEPCTSTFVMVRLPAQTTCEELLTDVERFD